MVDNFILCVSNVLIYFEDDISCKDPFSFGIHISEMHINTCNSNWKPGFIDRTNEKSRLDPLFKSVSIQGFSLFWHPVAEIRDSIVKYNFADMINSDYIIENSN